MSVVVRRNHHRQVRVANELRRRLQILSQVSIHDNMVRKGRISRVEVSRDLSHAKVYVLAQDAEVDCDALVYAYQALRVRFQSLLATQWVLKKLPRLKFYYDEDTQYARKMYQLLAENSD